MSVFIDTAGLLAVLDADDRHHRLASRAWRTLVETEEDLITTSYVLVESFALVQARLGLEALRVLDQDLLPVLRIVWIDEHRHRAAVTGLLTAGRRRLSLVDCASFETMRHLSVTRAFTFDRHFREQGFEQVP